MMFSLEKNSKVFLKYIKHFFQKCVWQQVHFDLEGEGEEEEEERYAFFPFLHMKAAE